MTVRQQRSRTVPLGVPEVLPDTMQRAMKRCRKRRNEPAGRSLRSWRHAGHAPAGAGACCLQPTGVGKRGRRGRQQPWWGGAALQQNCGEALRARKMLAARRLVHRRLQAAAVGGGARRQPCQLLPQRPQEWLPDSDGYQAQCVRIRRLMGADGSGRTAGVAAARAAPRLLSALHFHSAGLNLPAFDLWAPLH